MTVNDMDKELGYAIEGGQQQIEDPRIFESESAKFSEMLLSDDLKNVPPNIPENFWVFFDKELSLSNFTEQDIQWIMFKLDEIKLDTLMCKPDFESRFEDLQHHDGLKIKALAKIKRSTGGQNRERALFASQIRQFITNENEGNVSGGFLSKVGGIFGGSKK